MKYFVAARATHMLHADWYITTDDLSNNIEWGPYSTRAEAESAMEDLIGLNNFKEDKAKLDWLIDICQEFVDRVERGEVRSTYTYRRMKDALAS